MRTSSKSTFPLFAGFSLVLLLLGCQTTGDPSARQQSRLFATERADFMIIHAQDDRETSIHYRVRISPRREIEEPMILRAEFENPGNPGRPVRQQVEVNPGDLLIGLESPPVWGLRPGQVYQVTIEAYDRQGNRLGVHRQGVYSSIDSRSPQIQRRR